MIKQKHKNFTIQKLLIRASCSNSINQKFRSKEKVTCFKTKVNLMHLKQVISTRNLKMIPKATLNMI